MHEQEKLEIQKAEYIEKMKNKIAMLHKEAEEKRAMIEAKRGEELIKAEELAAKHRATGTIPTASPSPHLHLVRQPICFRMNFVDTPLLHFLSY
ncbi:unnamed protein product [Cuscuta campestris]|uniref:Remorin C-terminal domain-containing protein n=1 Tax=Cuscuta campestris TaxID=132261 RepID=A0A484LIZ6_9ASTE|nr:unnamed protein product [Cuscuta campestris]